MLTAADVDWIRSNRAEITAHRTRRVAVEFEILGDPDPYTGEPTAEPTYEIVDALWRPNRRRAEKEYVNGIEVETGDVIAVFDLTLNVKAAKYVLRSTYLDNVAVLGVTNKIPAADDKFRIVTAVKHGLGVDNRYTALLRRVT